MKVSGTMKQRMKRDFLIALMNNKRDFRIAQEQRWYRIPVKTKQVPKSVINKSLKHIAFYHTKEFGQDAYRIRWYGEVKNISIVKRKELLPEIQNDPKANDEYYKIGFGELHSRAVPIISRRPRRILFIPTTLWHFQRASEINEVFHESPLEEEFWEALRDEKKSAKTSPSVKVAVIIAIPIPAAIKPYSIAVAPEIFLFNSIALINIRNILVS